MTTAHRPTFDPARGKEAQRGPAYHQRLLPAHTILKHRQSGQGTAQETGKRDLRAELLRAEAAHFSRKRGSSSTLTADGDSTSPGQTPQAELKDLVADSEDPDLKRRRLILEEAQQLDADEDDSSAEESESDESEEEEDETAELMRELEKIKRERAEQKAREEEERAAQEEQQRQADVAQGNPLLNARDFTVKRRWDEDVVFKNQARGVDDKKPKEFVNDLLRSDFHKRFMSRYIR